MDARKIPGMIPARILIIDDNRQILESLRILLKDEFETIDLLPKPSRIPEMLWRNTYDIVMLDMNFAMGDIELAVKAIREGATDFIAKPWDAEKLIITLKNAWRLRRSGQEVKKLKNRQQQLSEDLDREYQMFHGTSEVIAREIHRHSNRADQIFVGVDVASLSESLFESEMFGHVKGAFTDARDDRVGRFENAHEGTLFLDEIGNIPLPIQAKLLQVIQNRELIRVGDQTPARIDIRLITATNQPLQKMVAEGSFREDLFYRLNTVAIEVPPLRERGEDVVMLGEIFLEQYSRKYNKPNLKLNSSAIRKLREYAWPGNVRELKHTMERAVIMGESSRLGPDDLRLFDRHEPTGESSYKLDDVEKLTIIRVLNKCRGNHSRAAQMLDISRTTLYAKLKKYEI